MSCKEKIVSHSCVSQGSLLSGGYKPYPLSSRGHNGIYARKPNSISKLFFDQFQWHGSIQNALLVPDLTRKPFSGDFERLYSM